MHNNLDHDSYFKSINLQICSISWKENCRFSWCLAMNVDGAQKFACISYENSRRSFKHFISTTMHIMKNSIFLRFIVLLLFSQRNLRENSAKCSWRGRRRTEIPPEKALIIHFLILESCLYRFCPLWEVLFFKPRSYLTDFSIHMGSTKVASIK